MTQPLRITIEKLVHGGSGMGGAEGKRIFVPYSAPGDVLDVEVKTDHGGFAEGQIVSVVKPAPCRAEPRCPVFGLCGGCQWQHLSYETQLEAKRGILKETLSRIGKIQSPEVMETLPSPKQWNYRNRIQLHVDSKGRVGFYRQKSKEVVEFGGCAIADERINEELRRRREEIAARDRGIAICADGGGGTARLASKESCAAGGSFAQVNTEQNENLKAVVAEWLGEVPHETVLELYAGSGNLTFPCARVAGCIFASDVDARAIASAREKQAALGICNVEFSCAAAGKATAKLRGRCDAVLVDPPRKGCGEVIGDVTALKPASVLYVSCDPATLARDALALAGAGFRLKRSLPIDMFPQTFHVESLNLFSLEK